MTPAQKSRYTAILNAQISMLNSVHSTFNTNVNAQVAALNTFKSGNDTTINQVISDFGGPTEQVTTLQTGKTQFDNSMTALVSSLQSFQASAATMKANAVADLQDIIDSL